MIFSERIGKKPIKNKLQIGYVDRDLRNRLWNLLNKYYWEIFEKEAHDGHGEDWLPGFEVGYDFLKKLYDEFFKEATDNISLRWEYQYKEIKKRFFNFEWYEVYDFVEYVVDKFPLDDVESSYREVPSRRERFIEKCNDILEQEASAYHFVGRKISPITSEVEIKEIEKAIEITPMAVAAHINRALELLSDRRKPDYRNSIKESSSAIESIIKLITGDDKSKLQVQKHKIGEKIEINKIFINIILEIYGYASDVARHGKAKEAIVGLEDAVVILVSCSAFINYLKLKASKAGIEL